MTAALHKSLAGTGLLLLGFASLMDWKPWLALTFLLGGGAFFVSHTRQLIERIALAESQVAELKEKIIAIDAEIPDSVGPELSTKERVVFVVAQAAELREEVRKKAAIIRSWQRFASLAGKSLGCSSIDTEILGAITALKLQLERQQRAADDGMVAIHAVEGVNTLIRSRASSQSKEQP